MSIARLSTASVGFILLAVGMAGCTSNSAAPTADACRVEKAADLPAVIDGGFVTVAARINDKPVTMVVDTGAELLQVTPAAVAALGLSRDAHNRTTLLGTGGARVSQNARLQSLSVGGMDMLDQSAAVAPLPVLVGPALHTSGLLGANWLRDFNVDFDLAHGRLALYRVQGCHETPVPWAGAERPLRFRSYGQGIPLLPITLDGQGLTAALDSGAAHTTIKQSVIDRAGVSAGQLAHDGKAREVGVDGGVAEALVHRFGELSVADTRVANPVILVAALHVDMADMLLGVDWLRHHRVWIDYAGHRITVLPEE